MTNIVKSIFSGFSETITGLTGGIKEAFVNIIYKDATAEVLELSAVAEFGFIMLGISMAIGLGYLALKLIKR